MRYRAPVHVEGFDGEVRVDQSGYAFALGRPIEVEVLPGRVIGHRRTTPTRRIPVATAP